MFADFNEIDLEKYPNVNVEYLEKTREFPGGRTSFFPGFKNYERAFNLVNSKFKERDFFEAAPYFFELYKNQRDKGIIVDSKKLELRILEEENIDDAFKIYNLLKENNLNYKIIKEFD